MKSKPRRLEVVEDDLQQICIDEVERQAAIIPKQRRAFRRGRHVGDMEAPGDSGRAWEPCCRGDCSLLRVTIVGQSLLRLGV